MKKNSLVAEKDGEMLGHVLFIKVSKDPTHKGFNAVILGSLAVKPGLQRHGISPSIISEGIKVCKSYGYTSIIVIGHSDYYS